MIQVFRSKYHSKKTVIDGITFASKKEANYYCELLLKKKAGMIQDFRMQVPFELQPPFKYHTKGIRAITYIADFVIEQNDGSKTVVDVKGFRTETYKLKRKMFMFNYPEYEFVEV